jgi:hypothetical protein
MIKQVSMMKRHPNLSMEAFVERYESHHAKFGEVLFAKAERFVRRYVNSVRNPLTGETRELDFDVIMEIWWDSKEDFDAAMQGIAISPLLGAIKESGATLFASHDNPAFTVTEYDSDLKGKQR